MTNLIYDAYDNVPAQRKAVARFTYHDNHTIRVIRLTDGYRAECDTCALPAVTAKAALFMHGNNIHTMTIDGATLTRI